MAKRDWASVWVQIGHIKCVRTADPLLDLYSLNILPPSYYHLPNYRPKQPWSTCHPPPVQIAYADPDCGQTRLSLNIIQLCRIHRNMPLKTILQSFLGAYARSLACPSMWPNQRVRFFAIELHDDSCQGTSNRSIGFRLKLALQFFYLVRTSSRRGSQSVRVPRRNRWEEVWQAEFPAFGGDDKQFKQRYC